MKLPSQFQNDVDNLEEMGELGAVPKGEYVVKVKDESTKRNAKDTGDVTTFQLQIHEGEYKGRIIFLSLNLNHENPTTVEIANKTLVSMCKSCDRLPISDTAELLGCIFKVKVSVRRATANWDESNNVQAFIKTDHQQPPRESSVLKPNAPAPEKKTKKVSFDD